MWRIMIAEGTSEQETLNLEQKDSKRKHTMKITATEAK